MFRRIDSDFIYDKKRYKLDPNYLKALSLYMKSYEFEIMCDTKKYVENRLSSLTLSFTKYYLKAIELQKNAQRTVSQDTNEFLTHKIPLDVYLSIFSNLSPAQLLRLMRVNKVQK